MLYFRMANGKITLNKMSEHNYITKNNAADLIKSYLF